MTTQFYMAASALPRMTASFKVESPPISRLQLERRLKLLAEEERELLLTLETLLWQSWFMPQQPFARTREAYLKLLQQDSPFIHKILPWFMDLRSLFAALRMRKTMKSPPAKPQDYWLGQLNHRLIQHWDEPDFGLKSLYPWLPKVAADFAKEDTVAVEEFLLTYIWNYLALLELGHYFDFPALLIYLLRWDLVDYWSKFNRINLADELSLADIKGLEL